MKFGLDPSVIDERMIQDAGEDEQTASRDDLQPQYLSSVFGEDRFADRRDDVLDPFAYYYAVNVAKLPNLKHRMAIAAALDRAQIRTIQGGSYGGDLSDGVIKRNLPQDYAPTGMWTGLLGQQIPDTGDPAYASRLIEESGEPMPAITLDYAQTPERDKEAASTVASLRRAGIKVRQNPIRADQYFPAVSDSASADELMWSGWGPDWANASTIIPELFTPSGSFNLSRVDDAAYTARVQAAKLDTDRGSQAAQWKQLNREAMRNVWVIPTVAGHFQAIAGSKVKSASGEGGNP